MKIKLIAALLAAGSLIGCSSDADVASHNLSIAADNFKVNRRVIFYNSVTGDYMLSIEGLCSKGNDSTSRQGREAFKYVLCEPRKPGQKQKA